MAESIKYYVSFTKLPIKITIITFHSNACVVFTCMK